MIITVDLSNPKPAYIQIVDAVRMAIAVGSLQAGDRLPAIRETAVQTRVNRNTVGRAYLELEHQGLLRARQGSGFYVTDNGAERERSSRKEALQARVQEIAVVSSRGARAYHVGTFAGLIINTMSGTSAGWAKGGSWRLSDLDTEALGREAVAKAVDGQDPVAVEPGHYPVVLDTYAVDDILEALSLYGMGAQAVQEGRSWMNDFIGTEGAQGAQAMSPSVTIWDDGLAPQGWPVPFDAEGVPRRRVDIITGGW